MATINLGGRDLAVKHQQEPGGLGLQKALALANKKLASSSEFDYADNAAALLACYVGHNEGVTTDWLLEQLPADCSEILRRCIVASGGKLTQPGEGLSP